MGGTCRPSSRQAVVHKHMPELLQVLECFRLATPIPPGFRLPVQRCFGSSNCRGIQRPIVTHDPLREKRHHRSAKIVRNFADGEPKSTVPSQRDLVSQRQFTQDFSGSRRRKRRIRNQQFDISVQVDGAMYLRFDLGVEHAPHLSSLWVPSWLPKFLEDVQKSNGGQVGNPERGRTERRPRRRRHSTFLNFSEQFSHHAVHPTDAAQALGRKRVLAPCERE